MAQTAKTNAMRMLEKLEVRYRAHSYSAEDGAIDGVSVAAKIGANPEKVLKTLVAKCGAEVYVFCIPVAEELDLKAAARAVGAKSLSMAAVKELLPLTGYIRGGCSPVGMKKKYPTVLDSSVEKLDTVFISAGKIGMQMEMNPRALSEASNATFAPIALPHS